MPYAVKVHGSALEYTVAPSRALPALRAGGRARRAAVLVGSRHTAESLWEVLDEPTCPRARAWDRPASTCTLPATAADEAAQPCAALAERLEGAARRRPPGGDAATRRRRPLRALDPRRDRIVSYVGKLIVSKGVDLLLAAWPLVLARVPDARWRSSASAPIARLSGGSSRRSDVRPRRVRELAARGRELEGGPPGS